MQPIQGITRNASRAMHILCICSAALIVLLLVVVVGYLVSIGWRSVTLTFFTTDPIPQGAPGFPGGMRNGIVGTAVLIALASAVGIPAGALAGVYLSEYSADSKLAAPVRCLADVLAGVPS